MSSMRVNGAKLADYQGQTVRLTCKVLQLNKENATVEASDGTQVTVQLTKVAKLEASSYVEIIGSVTDSSTVKYMASIDLGPEFDLKIANDVIEMAHDREFQRHFSAKDDDPESMQF